LSSIAVLLGHGDGTLAAPALYPIGAVGSAVTINAADMNGDGRVDIVVSGNSDRVGILYGRCLVAP
ncbi:MAG TPA: VCBS repeat-containing protein, partial [Agromyces sp.]